MYGYIYITENLINHKKYIGQHKSKVWDISYIGSGKVLSIAIEKYGKENFSCKLLEECNSEEELNTAEYKWIKQYNAVESNEFYNLVSGGNHRTITGQIFINKDGKEKKIYPEDLNEYLSSGWFKGKLPRSKDAIRITAIKNTGRKRSEETKEKISNALKGKKFSKEQIEKIAAKKRGRPTSRKGKVCVHLLGGKNIYINKSELETYISNGYIKGDNKKGKPLSKEHRESISKCRKGISAGPCSEETKKKISEALIGHQVSLETREKISSNKKGKSPWNKGLTAETDERVAKYKEKKRALKIAGL